MKCFNIEKLREYLNEEYGDEFVCNALEEKIDIFKRNDGNVGFTIEKTNYFSKELTINTDSLCIPFDFILDCVNALLTER